MRKTPRRGILLTSAIAGGLLLGIAAASVLGGTQPNIRALSPSAHEAKEYVIAELRATCLGETQASDLLASTLASTGATSEFTIRFDGPVAHPIGEGEAVREHLADGCHVYSGTGLDANGNRVFYLSGPDALVEASPPPEDR